MLLLYEITELNGSKSVEVPKGASRGTGTDNYVFFKTPY